MSETCFAGVWTEARLEDLVKRWQAGETLSAIARALDVSRFAVSRRLTRLGLQHAEPSTGTGARTRACLGCGHSFASEGPHNRICPACKAEPEWDTAWCPDLPIHAEQRRVRVES